MIGRTCIGAALLANLALAQAATTPQIPGPSSAAASASKPYAFDVVSIKPARPGESWHFRFGPTGYSAAAVPLSWVIDQAYFALNMGGKGAVIGTPAWVEKETWDIETKVASEDITQYQLDRTRPDIANPITRQMLQTMLADRCKLAVHRVPAEMPGFAIVLAKDGPKLTEAPPDQAHPSGGIPLLGGGFVVPYQSGERPKVGYFAVSMSTFAQQVRRMANGPVVDRTGLTGKYNFSLTWLGLSPDEREGSVSFDDPFPLSHWNFAALGLRIERVQIPTEHIVIDHIEKPSAN